MVRLAVYELTKLIAPNNVSAVRMRDYEDSMKWLNDAAKLRLNPQIPRKVDETKKASHRLATGYILERLRPMSQPVDGIDLVSYCF